MESVDLKNVFFAGGVAGSTVDIVLFPLDTLKTRLQSSQGLHFTGGFTKLYRGISTNLIGSAPSAALFFLTYETLKQSGSALGASTTNPFLHIFASSIAEISACSIRVPIEVIKQRMQVNQYPALIPATSQLYKAKGVLGFYRGFQATLLREIPFAGIQFPMFEYLKRTFRQDKNSIGAAVCGSFAGALAAILTTPLDVIKTRTILSKERLPQWQVFRSLAQNGGLFSGLVPRVLWISFGGFIFFGVYEEAKRILHPPSRNI